MRYLAERKLDLLPLAWPLKDFRRASIVRVRTFRRSKTPDYFVLRAQKTQPKTPPLLYDYSGVRRSALSDSEMNVKIEWRAQSRSVLMGIQRDCPGDARSILEVSDAKRVAKGQVGIMKFARMLGDGNLSQRDQDGYWQSIAKLSGNKLTQKFAEISSIARDNMTEHMRRTVAISLDRRKRLFELAARKSVLDLISYLRGKHTKQLGNRPNREIPDDGDVPMVAQSGFITNLLGGKVSVHHTISLGALSEAQNFFILRTGAFFVALSTTTTVTQRITSFVQYVLSFDTACGILAKIGHDSAQVIKDHDWVGANKPRSFEWFAQGSSDHPPTGFPPRGTDTRQDSDYWECKKEYLIAALCAVVAGAFKLESNAETWKNFSRVKRLTSIAAICTSTTTIAKFLSDVCEHVRLYAEAWSMGLDVPTYKLFKIGPGVPSYINEVTHLYRDGGINMARGSIEVAQKVKELFKTGSEYLEYVSTARLPSESVVAFRAAWDLNREMVKAANECLASHKPRKVPFCIQFVGETCMGKSCLTDLLAEDVSKMYGINYDAHRHKYNRNFESEYWEGYNHQPFVVFDDFLQTRDKRSRGVQSHCLIQAVNNAAFPLNMAAVAAKGVTHFTSDFIFITSNEDIHDTCVASENAVKRRRNMVVKVSIKPEYLNENKMLSPFKVRELLGVDKSKDIYIFDVVNSISGDFIARFHDYEEFLEMVRGQLSIHWPDRPMVAQSTGETTEFSAESEDELIGAPTESFLSEACDLFVQNEREFDELCQEEQQAIEKNFKEKWGFPDLNFSFLDSAKENCLKLSAAGREKWEEFKQESAKNLKMWKGVAANVVPDRIAQYQWIAMGLSFVAAAIAAYAYYKHSGSQHEVAQENFVSGDNITRKKKREFLVKRYGEGQVRELKDIAQSSVDPAGCMLVKNCYSKILCTVNFVRGEGSKTSVHGILLGAKLIVVPHHILLTSPSVAEIEVITSQGKFVVEGGDVTYYTEDDDVDMAVLIMPNNFPSFPKSYQYFVNERDIGSFYMGQVALISAATDDSSIFPMMQIVRGLSKEGPHTYVTKPTDGSSPHQVKIVSCFKYNAHTSAGDCGSPLVWLHPSVSRKIIGFHVAGGISSTRGASNILTYERMLKIFRKFNNENQGVSMEAQMLEAPDPQLKDGLQDLSMMNYVGMVEPSKQFRQPTKTTITPSLLHGVFPPTTAPSVLNITDGISPLELGVRKFAVNPVQLPVADLELVRQQVEVELLSLEISWEKRVLTLEEGLNGVAGSKWIRPLDMKTSAGYPWVFQKGSSKGKLALVERDDDRQRWVYTDTLREAVIQRIELAKRRIIPETIFVDVLKDERRPLAKIAEKKTRIFNTCPVDLNIAIRMYYSAFAAHIMDKHLESEVAVGINYHSSDWAILLKRLLSMGNNFVAGDYSNYDKSFPRQLVIAFAEVANSFYNDECSVERMVLMETIATRYHLCNKVVHLQVHGNPSGQPMTTILNSVGSMMLLRLAYLELARVHSVPCMYNFADNVALSLYGDDVVGTVSDSVPWYNNVTISETLSKWGVTYTPPKVGDGELKAYESVDEVTFLKRRFRAVSNFVFAPLPMDVIREIINWVRVSPDPEDAILTNIYMAQLEISHWGREVYDDFSNFIKINCVERQIKPKILPYDHFLNLFFTGRLNKMANLCGECELLSLAPEDSDAALLLGRRGDPSQVVRATSNDCEYEESEEESEEELFQTP